MVLHRNILVGMAKKGLAQEVGITAPNRNGVQHVIVNNLKDQRTDHYVASAKDAKDWEGK